MVLWQSLILLLFAEDCCRVANKPSTPLNNNIIYRFVVFSIQHSFGKKVWKIVEATFDFDNSYPQ